MATSRQSMQVTALLLIAFSLDHIGASKFTYPSVKETRYVKETSSATLQWEFGFDNNKNEGLIRIDCGFFKDQREMQVLVMVVGTRNVTLNTEDFPPQFQNRVQPVNEKEGQIGFIITDFKQQDEKDFLCRMFYWEGEIYGVKGPIFSLSISLRLTQPQEVLTCLDKDIYELEEGKPGYFKCNISGRPLPTVNCTVLDSNGKPSDITATSSNGDLELSIQVSSPLMATIRCESKQAQYPDNVILRESAINVLGKPRNVKLKISNSQPKNLEIIRLDCAFDANPPVENVYFFKGGNMLVKSEKISYSFMVSSCIMGTAMYRCEVENRMGRIKSAEEFIQISEAPKIAVGNKTTSVMLGERVAVTCTAFGCPVPAVSWTKRDTSNFKIVGSTLSFSNFGFNNVGTYICHAHNEKGTTQENVTLSIQHKPMHTVFESNAVKGRIRAGNTLKLRCSAKSSPLGSYSFYKNGNLLVENESGETMVKDVSCTKDGGNYSCVAENKFGQGDKMSMWIYVEGEPIIITPPKSQVVNLSSTVVLKCLAQGCPQPRVFWRRKGITTVIHSGNELQIKAVRKEDASVYVCVASNRIGQRSVEASIRVLVQKQVKKENSADRLVGEMVLFLTIAVVFSVWMMR